MQKQSDVRLSSVIRKQVRYISKSGGESQRPPLFCKVGWNRKGGVVLQRWGQNAKVGSNRKERVGSKRKWDFSGNLSWKKWL